MDLRILGRPASPGIASGIARVVTKVDPSDVEFNLGEILIVPFSNPLYYHMFLKAAAVVAEHGGVTSHAASLAREMGLPCVVAATHATTLIKNGSLVRVNGDVGLVDATERTET